MNTKFKIILSAVLLLALGVSIAAGYGVAELLSKTAEEADATSIIGYTVGIIMLTALGAALYLYVMLNDKEDE